MSDMNIEFKIDKHDNDYATFTIKDNNNYVSYMYKRIENDIFTLVCFTQGKVNNTLLQQDNVFKKTYMKNGKGKIKKSDLEIIKAMHSIALQNILYTFKE